MRIVRLLCFTAILAWVPTQKANSQLIFAVPVEFGAGQGPESVAIGDFNEDGHQDLAVANEYSDAVSIHLGNGDGTFQAPLFYGAGYGPESVAVGDFNEDGHQDLAVANNGWDHPYSIGSVSIHLGNGDGTFQDAINYLAGFSTHAVAIGDFNEDGHQDLVVANIQSGNVSILSHPSIPSQ